MPPREAIHLDEHWRVCHSYNSSLPGWLVLVPLRHVTAIHELTPEEVERLGPLVRDLSLALRIVIGCQKTYVMQFAEAPGHSHVHFHVVPRMADFSDEERGANVFTFLGDDESKWVDADEMDRIALAIRAELQ